MQLNPASKIIFKNSISNQNLTKLNIFRERKLLIKQKLQRQQQQQQQPIELLSTNKYVQKNNLLDRKEEYSDQETHR